LVCCKLHVPPILDRGCRIFYLAGAYGLQGDLDHARSTLAESIRLKPAVKSLDRMRVENAWLGNSQYWALQEKTLNLGLRRAGLPDH